MANLKLMVLLGFVVLHYVSIKQHKMMCEHHL